MSCQHSVLAGVGLRVTGASVSPGSTIENRRDKTYRPLGALTSPAPLSLCIDSDNMTDLEEIPVERKRRGPGDLNDANENATPRYRSCTRVEERRKCSARRATGCPRRVVRSIQEDHRARFYEHYRKEAEEYGQEFMKKHEEDLNTTLIFVRLEGDATDNRWRERRAGLFFAVVSAFIVQVQSQLRPDPNEEIAALLRVLIHKIDNTTFGGDIPALPQWTGPPRTIIHQWLNQYASIDMRGSAVERSQNRQRKLDGIVVWYFDHEIDTTVASAVLGVTSFGDPFYFFIVFVGATSDSYPYQTSAANTIPHVLGVIRRAPAELIVTALTYPLALPVGFTIDALRLGRAMLRTLVVSARRAHVWLFGTSPVQD
ncbi:hypothetical protein BDM02DRAFT_3188879 [Thelephora ganbajun]|uniref:Uncharacterized protein n=1 Tax=Thelephora ganbajun TaxID=370292 RepID=A0ACB6Z9I8_THEGA|nr:hypothetical protein BDM02DRAFT_3188879 [Thelephora ganbajun]